MTQQGKGQEMQNDSEKLSENKMEPRAEVTVTSNRAPRTSGVLADFEMYPSLVHSHQR